MIKISTLIFFPTVFVYIIVSCFLFLYTTGGWTGLLIIPLSIFLAFIFAIFALIIFTLVLKAGLKKVVIPIIPFLFLIMFQAIYLLFAPSDCGDFSGSNNLYSRFYGFACDQNPATTPDFLHQISRHMLVVGGAYIVTVVVFLTAVLKASVRRKKQLS